MPDEVNQPTPGGSTPPEVSPAGDSGGATPAPDWKSLIDTADPNEVRRHPRIAGIVGQEFQRREAELRRQWESELRQRAENERYLEKKQKAIHDPIGFTNEWLADEQKRESETALQQYQREARAEIARAVGKSFIDLPEWAELTAADHEQLVRYVAGKTDDEVIPAYNSAAVHLLAEKRAHKRLADWKQKELEREREAVRKEVSSELLQQGPRPDIRPGRPTTRVNGEPDFGKNPAAWNRWYEETHLGIRRPE